MDKGDVVTIFTPDDTHFEIALACIEAGLHVLCAKPVVGVPRVTARVHHQGGVRL
jgi:predicted dehydrogenase